VGAFLRWQLWLTDLPHELSFLDRIIAEVKSQTNNGFQVKVISPNPPF